MKLIKNKLANTFALGTAILWIICSAIVWALPSFSIQVTSWWIHGIDLMTANWNLNLNNFIFGGITIVASAWVSGWIFGWSWEQVSKK